MSFLQTQKIKINSIKRIILKLNKSRFEKSTLKSPLKVNFINLSLNAITILPKVFYIDSLDSFYPKSSWNIINFIKKKIILKYLNFNWRGLYNNYNSQFPVISGEGKISKFKDFKKKKHNQINTIFGFKISTVETQCFQFGFYVSEISETFLILNILNKYENFLDIGSNLGFYSSLVSMHKKKVFCFEPNPFCFKRIEKNKYIRKFKIGMGNKEEFIPLNIVANPFYAGSSFDKTTNKPLYKIKSKIVKLDNFVKKNKLKKKTLIKIDCEGFEGKVLHGGSNYIKKYNPDFIIDIRNKSQFDFLKNNNYKIFPINKDVQHNKRILFKEMKYFYLSNSIQNAYCTTQKIQKEKSLKMDLRYFCSPKTLDEVINKFKEFKLNT